MSGMYPRQWTDRQNQAPPRKRRLVTYTMQPLNEQPGHRFGVNRVLRFGNDGNDGLLSAGRDGVVRRWDVSSMLSRGRGGERVIDNGRRDSEGDDNAEQDHQQPPCTGVFASHTDWVTGLAVAEGRIMASASYDGTLKLWDLASADRASTGSETLGSASRRTGGSVVSPEDREQGGLGWEERRREGANGGTGDRCDGSTPRTTSGSLPRPPRPNPLATVAGHGDYVKCLTYAPQGGVLVSGGLDKRILLWDLQRMSAPLMVACSGAGGASESGGGSAGVDASEGVGWGGRFGGSNAMTVNDDDAKAAGGDGRGGRERRAESDGAGAGDGGASWWDEAGGREAWTHLRYPSRVVLRPGQAAAGPNEVLELCRQNKGSVYCVDAAADASLVASGGTDRMIRLLDPRAGGGTATKICKLDGHGDNVRCVKIDEGGTRVVSGSSDGTIRVWDVRQQCCLGVYELPGGSVWAMQQSPCDSDVYYSGGRGRRVYRTDFGTGESTLVCMTNSEVLDMALELGGGGGGAEGGGGDEQPMFMWLSSTQPHIALWGGEASGGGKALRAGRPTTAAVAAAPSVVRSAAGGGGGGADASTAAENVDVFDVTPPFAEETGGVGGAGGGTGAGPDDGGCLLDAPVGLIRGQPGVVRHIILNNRRHVLTEDDARPHPNVALWDVTKARQVEAYPPGTVLEDKERSLLELIAVRPWFTVDTHLGTPLVSLSESNVFDGELYAVDARGERQTFLASPSPSPTTAGSAPSGAGATEVHPEASPPPPATATPSTSREVEGNSTTAANDSAGRGRAGGGVKVGNGNVGAPATGTPPTGVRASKVRSVQDEVKVNLGDAALRGLFSRWVDQCLRLHDDGGAPSSSSTSRHQGSTYSSVDCEDDEDDDSDEDEDDESDGGHERETDESRSSSTRSARSSQASPGPRGGGGGGGGGGSGANHGYGSGGSIKRVGENHMLELDLASGGGAVRAIGDDTMLWVTETDLGGHGGIQRTLLQKRVGEFDGTEGQDVIPHWAMKCVLHGEFRVKEQPKVAFFLAPWIPPERRSHLSTPSPGQQQQGKRGSSVSGEGGRSATLSTSWGSNATVATGGKPGSTSGTSGAPPNQLSQRFTAPAQMLVAKVMAYVLSHDDLCQHLENTVVTSGGGGGPDRGIRGGGGISSPSRETPEDLVEVLCCDRVVEPHLYIGAIQQYIWNPRASGTLFLQFRSRRRPNGDR